MTRDLTNPEMEPRPDERPDPPPAAPVPSLPAPTPGASLQRLPKSPGLALLLSFLFPGIGQVYNGQPAKALVFFFGLVGSIWATAEIDPLPFAFLIPFVFFYNMVDAYRSAVAINDRAQGGKPLPEEDVVESPAWGAGLVLLGLLLLLNNLGLLRLAALRQYWPVILIAAGGVLLYGSFQRRKEGGHGGRT